VHMESKLWIPVRLWQFHSVWQITGFNHLWFPT
jgi:hypothetical protein